MVQRGREGGPGRGARQGLGGGRGFKGIGQSRCGIKEGQKKVQGKEG